MPPRLANLLGSHVPARWSLHGLCVSALMLLVLLAGCTSVPAPPRGETFFHDELFGAPTGRIEVGDLFALNDDMRSYVHSEIAYQLRTEGVPRGLINALYKRGQLKLEYDAAMTRNAAQAFDARKGNCLSLVIMSAAFAKELGLHVDYQRVATEDAWSRSDDIAFLSGHVNLTLGMSLMHSTPGYDGNRRLTIDFLPPEFLLGQRTSPISEETVVAMYMNNRSAESLARGELNDAYWWARGAILESPTFSSPYNTLGVVYLRHGNAQAAEPVLRYLLEREPRNSQALSNLATVLDRLGRSAESSELRVRLARMEPYPPYHFFRLGMTAMKQGDYKTAKSMFVKEVDRASYSSEFHFWLAMAELGLGDVTQAQKELATAMENSTTGDEHKLYAAKLDKLRSLHAQ
jgi:Tetratricopeptide repeat